MNTNSIAQSIPTGEKLTVGVVGLGYLGAVHAAGMAALGHRVVGYDIDPRKVDALSRAQAPFFEPGLEELLAGTQGENLLFTHDVVDLKGADVVFVAVGTPQRKGELAADTSYVTAAVEALAEVLPGPALIVGKSTVPVGTAARLAERLAETAPDLEVAWNPEFLREGHAVEDTLRPDRLVFGVAVSRAERRGAAARRSTRARSPPAPRWSSPTGHRGAGQGGRQLVPRHEDLVHQRDGRGVPRRPART